MPVHGRRSVEATSHPPALVGVEVTPRRAPRRPAKLGPAGRKLWANLTGTFEFDEVELVVLEAAARQVDLNARLEELVAGDGLLVVGAAGQTRLSAAVVELRHGRRAVAQLLGELAIPGEDGKPVTASSRRAKHAADVRWSRQHRGDD